MKTLNIIDLQRKQEAVINNHTSADAPNIDQLLSLVEVVKLYRRQEQAYFEKVKRKVFAKDELHHMKETQQKLDRMLSLINL